MTIEEHSDDDLGEFLTQAIQRGALSRSTFDALSATAAKHPDNLECRLELLAHFIAIDEPRSAMPHLAYVVSRRPKIPELSLPFVRRQRDPELFDEFKSMWLVASGRGDLDVQLAAFRAIGADDFECGQKLADVGLAHAKDDTTWLRGVADFYLRHGYRTGEIDLFLRSSMLMRQAIERTAGVARLLMLASGIGAAIRAGDDLWARSLAIEALGAPLKHLRQLKHLKHYGHWALGELALRSSRIEEAERELLASATDVVDFHLRRFGPRIELAKRLLELGRYSAVRAFLSLLGTEWAEDAETLGPLLALGERLDEVDDNGKRGEMG